jgi:hypothetical protein
MNAKRPYCFACTYFYITYEPSHPYGCRRMSFKSKELPCVATYTSSGMECQCYEEKKKPGGDPKD